MSQQNNWRASCPECDATVRFRSAPQIGQLTRCPACNELVQVMQRQPLTLDWAEDEPGGSVFSYSRRRAPSLRR